MVDGVAVVVGAEVFVTGDDVGVFELLYDVELFREETFYSCFCDCFEFYDFDGYIGVGFDVFGAVDGGEAAFS